MELIFSDFFSYIVYMIEIIVLSATIFSGKFSMRATYVVKNICYYYGATMLCFLGSALIYTFLADRCNNLIIDSGILLSLILLVFGRLVDIFYNNIKSKVTEDTLNEEERRYIWGWSPLICSLFIVFYNMKVALILIAIFLGKYIWYDSAVSGKLSFKDIFKDLYDSDAINHKNIIKIKYWFIALTIIHVVVMKLMTYMISRT